MKNKLIIFIAILIQIQYCSSLPNANLTLVNVFSAGEAGYSCIKIPSLIATSNGTLIAFGEARTDSCSDFAQTALVSKRSFDGGKTWTPLTVVFAEIGHVIGNAAPVVYYPPSDSLPPKEIIVMPFCRDNRQVFVAHSTDLGASWSTPLNITDSVVKPHWPWVGTGPPASIQLSLPNASSSASPSNNNKINKNNKNLLLSSRILTPCYHTYYAHEDGELSYGHVMYSDDGGLSWSLGADLEGHGRLSNECQAAQLPDGTVLINARALGPRRLQTFSADAGVSFSPLSATSIPEPASGCEMSTVWQPELGALWLTGPTVESLYRTHMTLWQSGDAGGSWQPQLMIDEGPSGYSSMAWVAVARRMGFLYERSVQKRVVFVPDEISFAMLPVSVLN